MPVYLRDDEMKTLTELLDVAERLGDMEAVKAISIPVTCAEKVTHDMWATTLPPTAYKEIKRFSFYFSKVLPDRDRFRVRSAVRSLRFAA